MDEKHQNNQTPERFVHPSCRPGRLDSVPPGGAALAFLLLALGVIAFQFSSDSFWYVVAGWLLLAVSMVVGWRYRVSLRSVFRHDHDDDPRKLYNSRNA